MFGNLRQNRWAGRDAARRLTETANGSRRPLFDRGSLSKLAIGLVAAIATVAVIDVGGPPFTYRLGQTVQREIRAEISFEKLNKARTATRQQQAADAVPPIYSNNPAPVETLREAAERLLESIAAHQSFDQFPAATATEWGLTADTFAVLRATIETRDGQQAFRTALHGLFQQIEAHGLLDLDPNEPPPELRGHSKVQVHNLLPEKDDTYELADVSREKLLDPGGRLARSFAEPLDSKDAADRFFRLLIPRLKQLPVTLKHDKPATEHAQQAARQDPRLEEKDTYNRGDPLVPQDAVIHAEQLALLREEHEQFVAARSAWDRFQRTGSLAGLVLGLYALAGYYILRFEPRLAASVARVAILCALIGGALGLAKQLHADVLHGETIAIALAAMTTAIILSQQFALVATFGMGLLCAWMFGTNVNDFMVLTGGTAAAVLSLGRVRSRTKLIAVGTTAGLTYFALTWATGFLANQSVSMLVSDSLLRLVWGVLTGFLIGGILPFLEKYLGIVTDINLLELSDVNHPLLLDLMRKAPGTYSHSVAVATLAEPAAEQIGANGLLVRVGSYFHDVGKMLKPQYFVENQSDAVNRHDSLNPAMSTLIIIGHVKDGADLAHEHHLPEPIIDLIEQHHGTTLVEYFYQEATREVRENREEEADVEEAAFRYPGPKPQTKEACILMLADAVESASRTLSEPTPGRIEGLVQDLSMKRLLDGQFDECGITLQELATIKDSLIKSLNAIYHGRVKYQEQVTA